MKKLLLAIALCGAVCGSVFGQGYTVAYRIEAFLANQTSAPLGASPATFEFFSTVQHYVWLTNGTTYWNSTNVVYSDGSYVQRWTYNTSNNTPLFYGATNNLNQGAYVTNFINNTYIGDPQYIYYYSTNLTSNTNIGIAGGIFRDVPAWSNERADVGSGALSVTCNSLYSTNAMTNTFTFAKTSDGYNYDTLNSTNLWVITVPCFAGTNVCYNTNIPAYFFTGAQKIRLYSVATVATNTTAPGIIGPITLAGFHP